MIEAQPELEGLCVCERDESGVLLALPILEPLRLAGAFDAERIPDVDVDALNEIATEDDHLVERLPSVVAVLDVLTVCVAVVNTLLEDGERDVVTVTLGERDAIGDRVSLCELLGEPVDDGERLGTTLAPVVALGEMLPVNVADNDGSTDGPVPDALADTVTERDERVDGEACDAVGCTESVDADVRVINGVTDD